MRELEKFYQTKGREELRLRKNSVQYLEFLTAAKYLEKYLPPASRVLDSCAGSGIYAFYLADAGRELRRPTTLRNMLGGLAGATVPL